MGCLNDQSCYLVVENTRLPNRVKVEQALPYSSSQGRRNPHSDKALNLPEESTNVSESIL